MTIVWIILAALAYGLIGGFICGVVNGDEDYLLWYVSFWPVFILIGVLIAMGTLPYKLGHKLYEWWCEH